MDLQFYGANCLILTTKNSRLVFDDNMVQHGAKSVVKAGDIALFTGPHSTPIVETKLTIDLPGEYEVSDISIHGIQARAHMDEPNQHSATMYKIIYKDRSLLVTGHVYPELSDEQLEAVGMTDVMVVPVGGNGYTLDPVGALRLIRKIEPKIVVPTHYDDDNLRFEVPQQTLDQALTALSMEPKQRLTKLKLKEVELHDVTQLYVLEKV